MYGQLVFLFVVDCGGGCSCVTARMEGLSRSSRVCLDYKHCFASERPGCRQMRGSWRRDREREPEKGRANVDRLDDSLHLKK